MLQRFLLGLSLYDLTIVFVVAAAVSSDYLLLLLDEEEHCCEERLGLTWVVARAPREGQWVSGRSSFFGPSFDSHNNKKKVSRNTKQSQVQLDLSARDRIGEMGVYE